MDTKQTNKWAGYHQASSARQELPLNIRMAWERALQRKINPYTACPMEVSMEARAKIKADNKRLFVCAQSLFHATKYMVKENGKFCWLSDRNVSVKLPDGADLCSGCSSI